MNFIISLDHQLNNWLIAIRTESLNKLMLLITDLAEAKTVLILVFLTGLWLLKKRYTNYVWPLLIVSGGDFLSSAIGKIFFHRPRPLQAVYLEKMYSFPSSHASIAVAFFGFLTYIIWQKTQKQWLKNTVIFTWIIFCLLIGFTRLYLGVHYLSDVIGGYLIGIFWLLLGIWITKKTTKQTPG